MECSVLQCASGSQYEELLREGERLHRPLFQEYISIYGVPSDWPLGRHQNWLKIYRLRHLLRTLPLGTILLYLDADTRVRKIFDPTQAMGDAEFAAVKNVWNQLNVGVMFFRVTENTRVAIEKIWTAGPLMQYPSDDQAVVNHYVQTLRRKELPREWNSYRAVKGGMHPDPIISSWHGEPLHVAMKGLLDVG
jgi:hypothetical protein